LWLKPLAQVVSARVVLWKSADQQVLGMLNYRNPDIDQLSKFLEQFSDKKRAPLYSIGQSGRWMKKSHSAAGTLGPGQYKVDRDFPTGTDEMGVTMRTGTNRSLKYTFSCEDRRDGNGILKGMSSSGRSKMGPGRYPAVDQRWQCLRKGAPHYSMPSAPEPQEAVRDRKKFQDNPGPGVYEARSDFDAISKERQKAIERLARKARSSLPSQQYSHIFSCMKPRDSRGLVLPVGAATTGATESAPVSAAAAAGGEPS